MVKVKNIKKHNEFKEYRESRDTSSDDDFMLTITSNLLNNLGDRNNFIHKQINKYKEDNLPFDKLFKISAGLYICSLVTCWETFFRDLFIFICNFDNDIKARLTKLADTDLKSDLTIGEFTAGKYNFQNLEQTRQAFDFILEKQTVKLSEYFTEEVFQGVMFSGYTLIFKWISEGILLEKIEETLQSAFRIRHRVTHDANYVIEIDPEHISEIEYIFQVIPQFFMFFFASKYSQKRLVFNTKKLFVKITNSPEPRELPYAFNPKDFMSKDWMVVK
jgi:hypothetical protein